MTIENAVGVGMEKRLAEPGVLEMCETRETSILGFQD